ncbi:cell envelope integrity protein TolA [Massilia yuzhufengensis]|nr:cell envelope integrity protein TolA [Massilia yuzhufengensis]
MTPATASGAPYSVPPEPSRLPAFLLAVAAHAVLLGFLWFGVSWNNTEPVAVEAEVWDMSVQTAAAPPLPPPPAPEPEPEPAPTPPQRVVEPPPVERPVPKAPDINLQREKERKEKLLKEEERKREIVEKRERDEAKKKELAEKKKKDDELKAKELAKKEADDKKKADKLAAEKKVAADKAAKDKAAKAEDAKLAKIRADALKQMTGAMGTSGTAEKSTGPRADAGYVAAITAAIKSATAYGGSTTMPGNPKAVFKVDQLPTGEIMSVRLVKSSGVPEFDRAVENGIKKASPLPKKKDGTVERTLDVNFSMKDYD